MYTIKKTIKLNDIDFPLIIDYNNEDPQEMYFNFSLLFPNTDTDTDTDIDIALALVYISIKEGIIIIERLANNSYYSVDNNILFKGLGLRLWCFSIKYLLDKRYIALDDSIMLEPAGNDKLKKYYTDLGFRKALIKESKFVELSVNEFLLNC